MSENKNYLTGVRDYYGFRSTNKTVATLALTIMGTVLFGHGFAIAQTILFGLGIYLNKKYP
ncbi:hypothetical protein VA249_45980 (plasmid) [Vibrio alfacsensis]|uniref:hypothetical protein n=1 Tax=Vibrio alfacsensis TaxID=1074311 RepID=UPI001BED40A5|nr:hypothetical protein [Vibrio alfacsensis]BBM67952.1 hypothetical protein VA249_45980 [Vibrio alfacsensis]